MAVQKFRRRFRVPFQLFQKLCNDLRPKLARGRVNNAGVESIPYEVKILASLRRLGRGECWDTIVELTDDIPSETTLSIFFTKFVRAVRERYESEMIHPPKTEDELSSVLNESTRRGYPGCIGFMDGVHVHWDMCPSQWRYLCTGKNPYPTLGWQCAVNHRRRFISVGSVQFGSVNDMTAIKSDVLLSQLRHNPMYRDARYKMFQTDGSVIEESGLWLSVDGGYICTPELLVGDPHRLDTDMNFWTSFMESERKHIECAFGILKSRFRILRLPIRIHNVFEIDDMFVTCCILHNMCIDFDGWDDGWNLGGSTTVGGYGPHGLSFGAFELGPDGEFEFIDDAHHTTYRCGNRFYKLNPDTDHSLQGNLYCTPGTELDKRNFILKRDKMSKNWYYMYRHKLVEFK